MNYKIYLRKAWGKRNEEIKRTIRSFIARALVLIGNGIKKTFSSRENLIQIEEFKLLLEGIPRKTTIDSSQTNTN